jgi:hypothetical protein
MGSPALLLRSPAARILVALVFCYLAVVLLHLSMNPEMLRSEAGYYQKFAHSSAAQQQAFLRGFWKTSSHGHYTPLAFSAEFYFARFAGLRPNIWRARQLLLAGFLAFCLFALARAAAMHTDVPEKISNLFAAGLTVVAVAQPVTRDILDVLFHGIQLAWMTTVFGVAWALVRLPYWSNTPARVWLIALLSYASMHVLGLGLGVVAGTLAVLGLLSLGVFLGQFAEWRPHARVLGRAFVVLLLLGSVHTIAMISLNIADQSAGGAARAFEWRELVGLIALTPAAIIAGFSGAHLNSAFINELLSSAWPFGIAVLLAIVSFVGALFWRNKREPSPRIAAALLVAVFSAVLLFTLTAMIGKREMQEPSGTGLYGYLVGARYVLPMSVAWLGLAMSAVMLLTSRQMTVVTVATCLLGVAAVPAHFAFEARVRPKTDRLHGASHLQVWRDVAQVAREARAANLPVPNLPLERMALFGFVDVKFYEPILRDELHLPANEPIAFVDWPEVRDRRLPEFLAACPTLGKTAQLLDIPLAPASAKR